MLSAMSGSCKQRPMAEFDCNDGERMVRPMAEFRIRQRKYSRNCERTYPPPPHPISPTYIAPAPAPVLNNGMLIFNK